jgi:hypothetical protein
MIKHVKADSLASVFTDSTMSVFTEKAINNGVSDNSIIFITCDANDKNYGDKFVEGSKWIWAKGEFYSGELTWYDWQ